MGKIVTIFLIIIGIGSAQAQDVLKDNFNIELNLIGIGVNYEKTIADNFTVNGQIGYAGSLFKGVTKDVEYLFTTIIEVEPRFYHNFSKRVQKGKKTTNNSANYFGLGLTFIPDWLTTNNERNIKVAQSFNLIPKYGLRRRISGGLSFDFAFGIGYQWNENRDNGFIPELELGLSYSF